MSDEKEQKDPNQKVEEGNGEGQSSQEEKGNGSASEQRRKSIQKEDGGQSPDPQAETSEEEDQEDNEGDGGEEGEGEEGEDPARKTYDGKESEDEGPVKKPTHVMGEHPPQMTADPGYDADAKKEEEEEEEEENNS